MNDIVEFLCGDGRDRAGRSFDTVLTFDDAALERHHDFIQWLFPLAEPSMAVPGSPVLDESAIRQIRASAMGRERQARAAARLLAFYRDTNHWRRPHDHNHLRITRIIKSLRILSGDDAADAFRRNIVARAEDAPINAQTRAFWARA